VSRLTLAQGKPLLRAVATACLSCRSVVPDDRNQCEVCGALAYSVPAFPPRAWIVGGAAGVFIAAVLVTVLARTARRPPDHPSAAYQAAFSAERWVAPPTPPSASAAPSASAIEVEVAGPEIEGMDRDEAIGTLHKHDKAIRACAATAASASASVDPLEPAGGIRVRIEVRADGAVKAVEVVEHEPPDDRIAECVQKAIRKIKFKRPGAPASIVTAWSFVEETSPSE